ncbi:MAG: rRNA maturation RNase YbeY [Deltaproteobacteria bacterium]|nr:MAG: rRNA maturation RNase YbeY [Deltaproteobacteria bacterium]
MGVLIENRQDKYKIKKNNLKEKAQAILDALGSPDSELSILFLDDPQIAVLNKNYLQREGPTNVIAFPMREGAFAEINPDLLGDVVISLETAEKEGLAAGMSMKDRLGELMIHGILHLFGYDHEASETEAMRMEAKSRELLGQIRSPNRQ